MLLNRHIQQLMVVLLSFCWATPVLADNGPAPLTSDIPAGKTGNTGRDWVVEKTGNFLPLETRFVDENGVEVTLGSIIDRPTLILPIYFYCPGVCSKNLANMAVAMNRMNFEPGRDYRAIALSFSETETAENARRAKQNYLKLMYDDFPADSWTFLTGSAEAIKSVTDSVGYRFKKMEDGLFVHPSAVIAVAADGKIIRYVYGSFVQGDMDMAVSNAMEGTPALSVKRFLEFCLSYDPDKNKPIFLYVKIGVVLFFSAGIGLLVYFSRKKKRK